MAKYDPTKKYTWTPQDTFTMSGEEFGIVLNALRSVLNTPEAATILMAHKANEAIENIMATAVEQGIVKEVTESPSLKVKRNE